MYDVKVLDYNGQKLRQINLQNGEPMWSLRDVCKILGYKSIAGSVSQKLKGYKQQTVLVNSSDCFRGRKLSFIDKAGVDRLTKDSKFEDFSKWLENADYADVNIIATESKNSVQASIQKAQMLIRIAEHKAVPKDEQLRLLNIAVKELTGSVSSNSNAFDSDIMNLPEVFGFILSKKVEKFNDCILVFHPVKELADRNGLSLEEWNRFALRHNLKSCYTGTWQKVITPKGEAREFMYLNGDPYPLCRYGAFV